jgi:hypothetical protein
MSAPLKTRLARMRSACRLQWRSEREQVYLYVSSFLWLWAGLCALETPKCYYLAPRGVVFILFLSLSVALSRPVGMRHWRSRWGALGRAVGLLTRRLTAGSVCVWHEKLAVDCATVGIGACVCCGWLCMCARVCVCGVWRQLLVVASTLLPFAVL